MGAVDTTYTFTATDTITSTKMNNIIDQTTITPAAIIGTTLDVAAGQLKVRSQGITSNEMGTNSVVTAAITDSNVTTAKIADANVTQSKLAPNVAGNGPAFRAWANSPTSFPTATNTKIIFGAEDFDTNSNFASSRFTPTISGYYLIIGSIAWPVAGANAQVSIYKNTSTNVASGTNINSGTTRCSVSDIVYLNGSTDYVELFALHNQGVTLTNAAQTFDTFFSGCLIRSA